MFCQKELQFIQYCHVFTELYLEEVQCYSAIPEELCTAESAQFLLAEYMSQRAFTPPFELQCM